MNRMNDELKGIQSFRETFEEKAKEKGYYKGEDGEWWQLSDDKKDKMVKWFKLDEEYPDLADKTEELARECLVKYDDCSELKKQVYLNADRLQNVGDEQLRRMFIIAGATCFVSTFLSTKKTEEILVESDDKRLESLSKLLGRYYKGISSETKDEGISSEMKDEGISSETKKERFSMCFRRINEYLVRYYNDKLVEGNFVESLVNYSVKAFSDEKYCRILVQNIEFGIEGIGQNEDSGKMFEPYMLYMDELFKDKDKILQSDSTKRGIFMYHVREHGINPGTIEGFRNVIFPLLEREDPVMRPIIDGNNAYGVSPGAYGIADYTEECLLSFYRPDEIDKLVRIYHEIPTSNYRKFEQNRKDAARLEHTIIGERDFIHNELPGANEVLVAMRDYYNNRDSSNLEIFRKRLEELENKYHFGVLPNALNIGAYEEPVRNMSKYNVAEEGSPDETALVILDRLVKNTQPDLLRAPKTRDEELNSWLGEISPRLNERTGEIIVDFDSVGNAVNKMNEFLLKNRGRQGIFPSTIDAIAYLDKLCVYALRGIENRKIGELVFDSKFKEIVRFSQLTSSMKYDENDFEEKYRQIVAAVSRAYHGDGILSTQIVDGYRILSRQILQNVHNLSVKYAQKKLTKRFCNAVWSGNLSDELIGLYERVN